jgi:hypothetical protein
VADLILLRIAHQGIKMTTTLFLTFVALMATAVVALIARYLNGRTAFGVIVGLWFVYAGLMGYFGIVRNTTIRLPGIAFIVVPVVAFLLFFIVRSSSGERNALATSWRKNAAVSSVF